MAVPSKWEIDCMEMKSNNFIVSERTNPQAVMFDSNVFDEFLKNPELINKLPKK